MALNNEQKMALDTLVKNAILAMNSEQHAIFTLSDIVQIILPAIAFEMGNPSTSCRYSIDRVCKQQDNDFKVVHRRDGAYVFIADYIPTTNDWGFKKDKNRLYFDCLPENIYYDFQTGKFNEENIFSRVDEWGVVNNVVKHILFDKNLIQYEWLFNYAEDLHTLESIYAHCELPMYEKMPKGLYQYIQEQSEDGFLTADMLKEFYFVSKYGKNYKFVKALLDYCVNVEDMDFFLANYSVDTLVKICNISMKNGIFMDRCEFSNLIEDFVALKKAGYDVALDSNRDYRYNSKILTDIKDREKNNLLAKQLQKLNFINGYEKNNLVVVVPQSQEEKQAEGRMQNNCVGHYYDNSILRGENLIYFIRRKDNPEKSYITCRYSVRAQDTVEYKVKNNYSVRDIAAIGLIQDISRIIRERLGA